MRFDEWMANCKKTSIKNESNELLLEKQKGILLVYCIIQFRSSKTEFNIPYYIMAYFIKKHYEKTNYFLNAVNKILRQFSLNSNETEFKVSYEKYTQFENKGILYEKVFKYCKDSHKETYDFKHINDQIGRASCRERVYVLV